MVFWDQLSTKSTLRLGKLGAHNKKSACKTDAIGCVLAICIHIYIYIISIYYVYLHYNIYSINLSTNRTSEHTIFTITEVDLAIKHGVLTFKWLLTFILWFGSDWAQRIPRKRSSADRLRQMIRKHFFRQYGPKSETCKPLHGMILKPLQWCCRISFIYIYILFESHKNQKGRRHICLHWV